MYGKGCPHSAGKIIFQNGALGKNLISPGILREIENIAQKNRDVLDGDFDANIMFWYFKELNRVDGESILNAFISYFSDNLDINESKFKNYERYSRKRGQVLRSNESIPQLLGFAFADIYSLLLLHVNLGYSLSQVKGLIIRSMIVGNANFKYSPTGLITAITGFNNPEEELENIGEILKKFLPQKTIVHTYDEPSCPFILSKEVDNWIDDVMNFVLNEFIPKIQTNYKGRTKNFQENFFSGNNIDTQKNPTE